MMSTAHRKVVSRIRQCVQALVGSDSFVSWFAGQEVNDKDYIFINNSFVFRDRVKTTKNAWYLGLRCNARKLPDPRSLVVAQLPTVNADFKHFSHKSKDLPEIKSLEAGLPDQLEHLGELVFVLIGMIGPSKEITIKINHSLIKGIRFRSSPVPVALDDADIVNVSSLLDPEAVWQQLTEIAKQRNLIQDRLPDNLEAPFADAFEKLQQEACSHVAIPSGAPKNPAGTILGKLIDVLERECSEYQSSLKKCLATATPEKDTFNNLLRIAYNFASDATPFIDLLVSICDLKPALLWCTLSEHSGLASAFRKLPWSKSKKKPSLDRYEEIIAGARNHAFHNLFGFQHSMEVDVSTLALKARRLRLFRPFAQRKERSLEFEDQEIIDLLTQFTRAPETAVSMPFWERNHDVMKATHELLQQTLEALVLLRKACHPGAD
jgi:hypothetical protein